jgi:putative nucleotidyltransferase with HDIG domain/PAS domain S-box-containing protein
MTSDAPSPPPGPESPDAIQKIEADADASPAPPSNPRLKKVMHDISASLKDLQAAVKEAAIQPDQDEAAGAQTSGVEAGFYQDLFEFAPEAYLVTDGGLTIQESNQAAAAMLKKDRSFLAGKPLQQFIVEEDRPGFQANLIQLREGGEKRDWELRLQPEAGAPLSASVNVRAQTDHRDRLLRIMWLLRDAREPKAEEESLKSLLSRLKSSLYGLVDAFAEAVELKDPQTAGHQRRVAQLAVAIAREMDFSLNRLEGVKVAAQLHDIGKIAVPTEILSKPGALSDLESEFIKTHCQVGFELLQNVEFPWPVQQAILQHHERLDGSGYPAGLTDIDIILEARILGVADVVEAMICARSYGPAQGIDKALDEVYQKTGILYDPEVVDICLKLFVEKNFRFS